MSLKIRENIIEKYDNVTNFVSLANMIPNYSIRMHLPEEKIKNCNIDGYDFTWLKSSNDYIDAGHNLNNCLLDWKTTDSPVIVVKNKGEFVAAIEVAGNVIVQAYGYPERKKTLNVLLSTRISVRNMSMWIYRFLFVWDMYKQEDDESEKIIGAKIETVYLKDSTDFVYKVDRETFKNMVGRIGESYNDIINSADFRNCDYSLKRLLLSTNIAQHIERLHEIILEAEGLDDSSTIRICYSKTKICALKRKLEYLGKLFDISSSWDYKITTDKDDIEKIEKRHEKSDEVLSKNRAFFETLSQKKNK